MLVSLSSQHSGLVTTCWPSPFQPPPHFSPLEEAKASGLASDSGRGVSIQTGVLVLTGGAPQLFKSGLENLGCWRSLRIDSQNPFPFSFFPFFFGYFLSLLSSSGLPGTLKKQHILLLKPLTVKGFCGYSVLVSQRLLTPLHLAMCWSICHAKAAFLASMVRVATAGRPVGGSAISRQATVGHKAAERGGCPLMPMSGQKSSPCPLRGTGEIQRGQAGHCT